MLIFEYRVQSYAIFLKQRHLRWFIRCCLCFLNIRAGGYI